MNTLLSWFDKSGSGWGAVRLWAACVALVVTPIFSPVARADIATMGEAINVAGRQRMLSQRIAQSYIRMGLQPESDRGREILRDCVSEFERNLEDLKQFHPAASIRSDLAEVARLWSPYKRLALGAVNKDNASELIEQSNEVLAAAHAYVNKLEQLSGTSKAELINISGRQRMLSQRIAKNFLAKRWGIRTDHTTEALYEDLAEFENMLEYLMASDINTPEIDTQLHKVKGYLGYASKGFDGAMSLSESRVIHVVSGTTDYMLRGMDVTTELYAELLQ